MIIGQTEKDDFDIHITQARNPGTAQKKKLKSFGRMDGLMKNGLPPSPAIEDMSAIIISFQRAPIYV